MRCSDGRLCWQASSYAGVGPQDWCRSRLAGEEALEPCAVLTGAFAGKPAPTQEGAAGVV
ncbi:hypothetical protein CW358_00725 [Pseudomonas protegens]|nr:hypothetical protein CW358_00725 [Pseudomonas protegens]